MKRKLDNLIPSANPRAAEWAALLESWLRAEEDEEEAKKWEGWRLDEVNRQKLPAREKEADCDVK